MHATFQVPGVFRDLAREGGPPRYLAYYGGRGGAKSWSVIAWAIAKCWGGVERVVVCREILKSIKASSHQLCEDMIERMGLGADFEVQRDRIICHRTGSTIIQQGLKDNIEAIKGLEGITICIVDEAQAVSRASLSVLTPTIRAAGSVIVFLLNPRRVNDPVYHDYVLNTPPNGKAVRVLHEDNPHFPAVLRAEMEHMRATDYESYRHVWLGEPLSRSAAAVYGGKFIVERFEPDESFGHPLYGADFGFSVDPSAALRCFVRDHELYIDHEVSEVGVEIDALPAFFSRVPGLSTHVCRADSSRPDTIDYCRRHGLPKMEPVRKGANSIEEGIAYIRQFRRIVIHPRCENLIDEMENYSYKVDPRTEDVLPTVIDAYNHLQDSLRYALRPLIGAGYAPPAVQSVPAGMF